MIVNDHIRAGISEQAMHELRMHPDMHCRNTSEDNECSKAQDTDDSGADR